MKSKKSKSFFAMTAAERDADVKRFDKGVLLDQMKPLSPKNQVIWELAKRGRPAKPAGEKAARVLVTVEPQLLAKADQFAQSQGLSRSELVARGLRSVLAASGVV